MIRVQYIVEINLILFLFCFVGDAGYPLSPYLITPFRNTAQGSAEARFNTKHSKARVLVERSFGLLKSRFRCISGGRQLSYKPEKVTQIINVCAALHNICISYNVEFNQEIIDEGNTDNSTVSLNTEEIDTSSEQLGETVRNRILNSI